MAKRIKAGELDESLIIQSFKDTELLANPADAIIAKGDESPKEADGEANAPENEPAIMPQSVPREESRKRKNKGQDYESLFIRNIPITTRSGKTVYIRKEFHDRIMRIVQVIGFNEVSLFSYIDNVLEHHFNTYQDDISELYKQRTPDIF